MKSGITAPRTVFPPDTAVVTALDEGRSPRQRQMRWTCPSLLSYPENVQEWQRTAYRCHRWIGFPNWVMATSQQHWGWKAFDIPQRLSYTYCGREKGYLDQVCMQPDKSRIACLGARAPPSACIKYTPGRRNIGNLEAVKRWIWNGI